jgi:hypothetical protein
MCDEHSKTSDPAVGSTRLVRCLCFGPGAVFTTCCVIWMMGGRELTAPICFGIGMLWGIVVAWIMGLIPPNVGTERCGRPTASKLETGTARPYSLQ